MKASAKEPCSGYDAGLKYAAHNELRAPNKFICVCIHCRQQAVKKEDIKHTAECCFATNTFKEHKLVKLS